MNTARVARYLDVNEKKVYALVRVAGLPATKATGKWLFPKELVDEWLLEAAVNVRRRPRATENTLLMAGSNDPILESEMSSLFAQPGDPLIYFARVGSSFGIDALVNGSAHAAVAHMFDPTTGEYNLPFLDSETRKKTLLIPFVLREQGIIVRKDNPLGIARIEDLSRPGVRFINRRKGTGTRALTQFLLGEAGIDSAQVVGYTREAKSHTEVASAVSRGSADAGVGIRSVAEMFDLSFIPLKEERFDILITKEASKRDSFQSLLEHLRSARFKKVLEEAGGYGLQTMEILSA